MKAILKKIYTNLRKKAIYPYTYSEKYVKLDDVYDEIYKAEKEYNKNQVTCKKTGELLAENVVRVILNGILYDTSKAEKICEVGGVPQGFNGIYYSGERATLYKAKTQWFVIFAGQVIPVSEGWARDAIGRSNPSKYVEIFDEPEDA